MSSHLLPPPSLRRSSRGLLLGVFRGLAERQGWSILLTRVLGAFALLFVACVIGAHGLAQLLVAGFFYLLAAVLMPPPRRFP